MSDQQTGPATTPKVFLAISAITAALAKVGIAKERKNKDQNYSFRGIDDVYDVLAPMLPSNKLVILPQVLERIERIAESKSGGKLNYVVLKVQYAFISTEDGSSFPVVTYGEGMDSSDKATNKAFSAAYKYAVIQAFAIPVEGTPDADAEDGARSDEPAISRDDAVALAERISKAKLNLAKLLKFFGVDQLEDLNKSQLKDLEAVIREKEAKNANP